MGCPPPLCVCLVQYGAGRYGCTVGDCGLARVYRSWLVFVASAHDCPSHPVDMGVVLFWLAGWLVFDVDALLPAGIWHVDDFRSLAGGAFGELSASAF